MRPQQYAARFAAFMVAHIQDDNALPSATPPVPPRSKARELIFDPGEPLGLRFQWDATNRRAVVMRFRCLPDGGLGQAETLGVLVEGKSYLTHINGAAVADQDLASALGPIAAIQHTHKGETIPGKMLRLKFQACLCTATVMAHAHPRAARGRSRRLSAAQALPDNILGDLGALDSGESVPAYIARMCSFELPSYDDLKNQVLSRFGASVFELYQQQIQALLGLASSTYAAVAGTSDTQAIADETADKATDETPTKAAATTATMAAAAASAAKAVKAANKPASRAAVASLGKDGKNPTKKGSELETTKTVVTQLPMCMSDFWVLLSARVTALWNSLVHCQALPPPLKITGTWDEPTIKALVSVTTKTRSQLHTHTCTRACTHIHAILYCLCLASRICFYGDKCGVGVPLDSARSCPACQSPREACSTSRPSGSCSSPSGRPGWRARPCPCCREGRPPRKAPV